MGVISYGGAPVKALSATADARRSRRGIDETCGRGYLCINYESEIFAIEIFGSGELYGK
jgi:hypothetical protein